MHVSLTCGMCGTEHAASELQNLCVECHKPLLAQYDLDAIKGTFTPDAVRSRPIRSMWKFWDVLPVDDPSEAVSLGECLTPLRGGHLRVPFGAFENLFIQYESLNPPGRF
ncbi:MAG: threonine synthase, partial [Planctomycetes bacterium]|nr:threonine synthase [Planctomycetota bacterium]